VLPGSSLGDLDGRAAAEEEETAGAGTQAHERADRGGRDYQLRHEKVAGIDIAKASGMICLRLPPEDEAGKRRSKVWEAGATVPEIEAVAEELLAAGVELVSMESTSDYWRSWFSVLETAGLEVQLVNASQARNLPGRPKTDKATRSGSRG
jgi:transposase